MEKDKALFDLQKEIAKKIYPEAKTEEELKSLIPEASHELLSRALRNMLLLKLIKKDGYPVKYHISKEIADKLTNRRKLSNSDKNQIRLNIIIESKSDDKLGLRKAMEDISNKLKEDKSYFIYELKVADIIIHDNLFSTYIEAELSCVDLASIIRLIYYYGVTSIDVIKPTKLTIPISDLQTSLLTIMDMAHGYADIIFRLRKEISQASKLLKKK